MDGGVDGGEGTGVSEKSLDEVVLRRSQQPLYEGKWTSDPKT